MQAKWATLVAARAALKPHVAVQAHIKLEKQMIHTKFRLNLETARTIKIAQHSTVKFCNRRNCFAFDESRRAFMRTRTI